MTDRSANYLAATARGNSSLARKSARSPWSRLASKIEWEPQWIGIISRYPRTEAAFNARIERGRATFAKLRAEGRAPTRAGVPDGWAGKRQEVTELRAAAHEQAETVTGRLVNAGSLLGDADAEAALRVAFRIVYDESAKGELRLSAINIVCSYLKPKPTQKIAVTTSEAERWLAAVTD